MEGKGWIRSEPGRSENNRRARYYSLTSAGESQLEVEQDGWRQFQRVVDGILRKA
jgi:DNA-binding PadR family transcriptional regulator